MPSFPFNDVLHVGRSTPLFDCDFDASMQERLNRSHSGFFGE